MIQGEITKKRMEQWKFRSPEEEGFHEVIGPQKSDCESVFIYRLNLSRGKNYILYTKEKEMNGVCIKGMAKVSWDGMEKDCKKLDSFYVTGNMEVKIEAKEDCCFYLGAAVDEGYGKPFFRTFDKNLPLGEIHQIHGKGVGSRQSGSSCLSSSGRTYLE